MRWSAEIGATLCIGISELICWPDPLAARRSHFKYLHLPARHFQGMKGRGGPREHWMSDWARSEPLVSGRTRLEPVTQGQNKGDLTLMRKNLVILSLQSKKGGLIAQNKRKRGSGNGKYNAE